jgi:hypothetical protein
VRLRRPRDAATLHFFWLCLAFFGTFTFSFSGRLDRLDWFFYWADAVSELLLPPLFLHFALVFPERPRPWIRGASGKALLPLLYLPALLLLATSIIAVKRSAIDPALFVRTIGTVDRITPFYQALCFVGGLLILVRALRRVRSLTAAAAPVDRVGHGARRGPFAVVAALPFALGFSPTLPMELTVIPLARPARLCVGDRALSADGHRSDRQARARLDRRAVGDSDDMRSCCGSRARFSWRIRTSTTPSSRCSPRWWWCCSPSRSKTPCRTRWTACSIAIGTTTVARSWGSRAT